MALLRCDECGSSDTNAFGSWDTKIKILCKKCSDKKCSDKKSKKQTVNEVSKISNFYL